MESKNRLYNLILPVWMLWIFPPFIFLVLGANFVVDSVVLLLMLCVLKTGTIWKNYRECIWKVWGFGFLADAIGAAFLFVISEIFYLIGINNEAFSYLNDIRWNIEYDPYSNIYAFLLTVLAIAISLISIYLFNLKISFRKLDVSLIQRKKLALALAALTAPYLFLWPMP